MDKLGIINQVIRKFSAEIGAELGKLKLWETEAVTTIISTRIKLGMRQLAELNAISLLERQTRGKEKIIDPNLQNGERKKLEKRQKELKIETKLATELLCNFEDANEYYLLRNFLKEKGFQSLLEEFRKVNPRKIPLKDREIKEIKI